MIGVHEQGNDVSIHTTTRRYLRPEDLAERWGTTTGTLANWRVYGRGPAYVKIGTMVRYDLAAVEAYERANTVGPVSRDVGRILRGPRRADS